MEDEDLGSCLKASDRDGRSQCKSVLPCTMGKGLQKSIPNNRSNTEQYQCIPISICPC